MDIIDDILVQVDPLPAVEQDAYTVPNLQKTRVYGFDACNTSAAADKIRFAFARKGAAPALEQYMYYDLPISGNNTFLREFCVTLRQTDVIRVYSLNGTTVFTIYGQLT